MGWQTTNDVPARISRLDSELMAAARLLIDNPETRIVEADTEEARKAARVIDRAVRSLTGKAKRARMTVWDGKLYLDLAEAKTYGPRKPKGKVSVGGHK